MLSAMYPTLAPFLGVPVPTHGFFVALGVLVASGVFVLEARRRGQTDERVLYVVLGALVGGAVFMRLGTWLQHVDLRQNASLVEQWAYGNRSILGGLVGAWLGVHVAKRIVGYRLRTGDLFAPAVALGMAVGRIGCLLTEIPGTPTGSSYGITLDREAAERLRAPVGVPLHPSFVYEIAFHATAFAVLWLWLRHRLTAPGETLTFYLAAYGVFRFLVEFVRGNEVAWEGLTRPQLFLLLDRPADPPAHRLAGPQGRLSPGPRGGHVTQPPHQPGWPVPPPPPPRKPKAPLLLGALIGAVTPFAGLVLPVVLGNGPDLLALAPLVWFLLVPAAGAGLLFSDQTRRWGLGILLGFFGMLVVTAGACVAIVLTLTATSGG